MNINQVKPGQPAPTLSGTEGTGKTVVTGRSTQEINPLSVELQGDASPPRLFSMDASGLPPSKVYGEQSWDEAVEELGQLVNLAATSSGDEQQITLASAMRALKALMLKNRESESALRDQQILQGYDLKLKSIEQDLTTAKWQLASGIVKGSLDIASGAVGVLGAAKQSSMLGQQRSLGMTDDANLTGMIDAVGRGTQGKSQILSGMGGLVSSSLDFGASLSKAEADKLRAEAEKMQQFQNQTNDRFNLAREVMMEVIRTEKEINDAMTQAVNKRLSV